MEAAGVKPSDPVNPGAPPTGVICIPNVSEFTPMPAFRLRLIGMLKAPAPPTRKHCVV